MAADNGAEIVSVEVAEPAPGMTDACESAQDGSGAGPETAHVSWTVVPKGPLIPATVMTSVCGVPDCTDRLVDAGASEKSCAVKVAVTEAAAFRVTSQLAVPEQAPLHPVKFEVAFGTAVSTIFVPVIKELEHALPQLIPAGALVTPPPPFPAKDTVRAESGAAAKVAVTDSLALNLRVHVVAMPEHAPLQPLNSDMRFGVAVSVTVVPGANACEQDLEQFRTSD